MDRIDAPAQRLEIKHPATGQWIDITTAVEGFCVPDWTLETETAQVTVGQVIARCVVPLLEPLGLTVRDILEADTLTLRLFFADARSGGITPQSPAFLGVVAYPSLSTKLTAGDMIDLTAHDLLWRANQIYAPPAACGTEPARYGDLAAALADAAGLTVAETAGVGITSATPYVTHHPRPLGADPTVKIHGLAWWPLHGLLVCGVGEHLVGYSPSTGASYDLATSPSPPTEDWQVDAVWIDGTDIFGVCLPTEDAPADGKAYVVKADLSGFDPDFAAPPVQYTVYTDEPFKLWNAGLARIQSAAVVWRLPLEEGAGDLFIYWGNAIGLAGPVEKDYRQGWPSPLIIDVMLIDHHFTASALDFMGTHLDDASENPMMFGRNLFLPEETAVGVEYLDSDRRPAEVTAYRMPGPLAYYIPLSAEDDAGRWVFDLGNGSPYAEAAGTLPCTLPAGYYAFVNHGESCRDFQTGDTPPELVSRFEVSFTRAQRRPSVVVTSAGDKVITAEDTVDVDTLDEPLGPLGTGGADEFERLYYRDLTAGIKAEVLDFPGNAHSVKLARVSDTEALVVFACESGMPGAYGCVAPLTKLVLGQVSKSGSTWEYKQITSLGGWTSNDDPDAYYHYNPTTLAYLGGKAYVGYTRTAQRFVDVKDAPVCRAYVDWDHHDYTCEFGPSIIEAQGYHLDEIKRGDQVRVWPGDPGHLPYAPLSRTVLDVEWYEGRTTKFTVSPPLDCSTDGAKNPKDRVFAVVYDEYGEEPICTKGIEEYDSRYVGVGEFTWGPPTLQREAKARETAHLFARFDLRTATPTPALVDSGLTPTTETVTVEDDSEKYRGKVTLGSAFVDPATITLKLGGTDVDYTLDEVELADSGQAVLYVKRRFIGFDLDVGYSFWDTSKQIDGAVVAGSTVYYTQGQNLKAYDGAVADYGIFHYQAVGLASPLIALSTAPVTLYGVADGGGNLPFQLSVNHSGNVGDRSGWVDKGIGSCLSELALALGCVCWVDAAAGIHLAPRDYSRNRIEADPTEVIDYRVENAWQRPACSVSVDWPGGTQTTGYLSSSAPDSNKSYGADLVTSASWALALANHLYTARERRRASVVLGGLRLDLCLCDGLVITFPRGLSVSSVTGSVVQITPQLRGADCVTEVTLALE